MGKMFKEGQNAYFNMYDTNFIFHFYYLELNKLKIFKWKLIHFILPCKESLKQWRIVNNSDCVVCTEKENYKHFYFDCKYNKKYWQEVKKMRSCF